MKPGFSLLAALIRALMGMVLVAMLAGSAQPALLQSDQPRDLAARINRARLAEGLAPLSWSTLLAQAAQRHADDLATHNLISSTGSDGSTYRQRIRETGYRAWNDGLLVYETFWVGLGYAENALNWFRNDSKEWATFIDPRFREMGIGYAESQNIHYFVVSFGSRPGVLPVFINEGAEITDLPQVVIHLTNEEAVPLGEGRWIGKAIEVRLGETASLEDAPWQPWEPLLPWMLSSATPGDYAVYIEFRDGAGRTAISQDTIRLTAPGEAPPPPTGPRQEEPLPPVDDNGDTDTPAGNDGGVDQGAPEPLPTPETPSPAAPTAPPEDSSTPQATPEPPSLPESPVAEPPPALVSERRPTDWPLVSVLLLQGVAWLLGAAAFLRRK